MCMQVYMCVWLYVNVFCIHVCIGKSNKHNYVSRVSENPCVVYEAISTRTDSLRLCNNRRQWFFAAASRTYCEQVASTYGYNVFTFNGRGCVFFECSDYELSRLEQRGSQSAAYEIFVRSESRDILVFYMCSSVIAVCIIITAVHLHNPLMQFCTRSICLLI